jgi:hypothetical protein
MDLWLEIDWRFQMKIDFVMRDGKVHSLEADLSERELDEILTLIAHGSNLINVKFDEVKEHRHLHRRWVKAEDIEDVYVESDIPPEMKLAPSVEVIGQSDGNEKS